MSTTITFESLSKSANFDRGPGKFRVGLVALSNDYVTERDFMNMRPNDDVVVYTSRLRNSPECTTETLCQMAPLITEAASLIVPEGRLDVVAYSCTSGTAVMGFERIRSLIQVARPGVPVVTPITSSLAALDLFGAQRIAVLTPYVEDVNIHIAGYLENSGKFISAFSSFKMADNEAMAMVTPQSIYDAALEADRDDAEALFVSCTAIRAVDVVDRIEQTLGKPVVTAVQAMFWHSLRLSGFEGNIPGFGQIWRL